MEYTRVLIVDDAIDLLFLLKHSITRIGPEYRVETATDGPSALEKIKRQTFDLVICDYMMPGMSGVELAETVYQLSPETQVILMTAYDTRTLRDQIKEVKLDGYVGKPFSMDELKEMIERILAQSGKRQLPDSQHTRVQDQQIYDQLKDLRSRTSAHYVLLLDSEGHPLEIAGQVDSATASRLAAFVAANFLAVAELVSLLGDNSSIFRSSFHEGNNYSIYAHEITKNYLLAVVFAAEARPGTVWFYTKQAALQLAPLLGEPFIGGKDVALEEDFETIIEERPSRRQKS